MVAKLQGRPQLESQVLHDHVALQEQKGVPIDLLEDAGGDAEFCKSAGDQRGSSEREKNTLTCFLKMSAWGPRAWGSASLMNQTTSSTDQVVGSLLAGALDSWDSVDALYPKKDQRTYFALLYLEEFLTLKIPICCLQNFPPVLLLSGNELGLVADCRHMLMEAGPLENCCEERNP